MAQGDDDGIRAGSVHVHRPRDAQPVERRKGALSLSQWRAVTYTTAGDFQKLKRKISDAFVEIGDLHDGSPQ